MTRHGLYIAGLNGYAVDFNGAAGLRVHHAHHLVSTIGKVDVSGAVQGDSYGRGTPGTQSQRRLDCGAAVAAVTRSPIAGKQRHLSRCIHLYDAISTEGGNVIVSRAVFLRYLVGDSDRQGSSGARECVSAAGESGDILRARRRGEGESHE